MNPKDFVLGHRIENFSDSELTPTEVKNQIQQVELKLRNKCIDYLLIPIVDADNIVRSIGTMNELHASGINRPLALDLNTEFLVKLQQSMPLSFACVFSSKSNFFVSLFPCVVRNLQPDSIEDFHSKRSGIPTRKPAIKTFAFNPY